MGNLLDSLAEGFHGDAAGQAALDAVIRDGLPGARSEAWKYTSLRALERRSFTAPTGHQVEIDPGLLADIPMPRAVFVNGRYCAKHSDTESLPSGINLSHGVPASAPPVTGNADTVFSRLNSILAKDGVALAVASGVTFEPAIHLVFIGAASSTDEAWHLHHSIDIADGASISIIEHHLSSGEHRHLENARLTLRLENNAKLRHARVQSDADGAVHFLRTDAVLSDGALYERMDLELGSALSRHELNVRLEGAGAKLTANGVLLASGKRHLDTRLGIEHVAADTACELAWRGIGSGRGRVVFHGGITIHAGADGADATLSNKNLLLDVNAEIDSQPVLVIHADEVKAAHGATVGQLDPTAMFYLRSRGLPEDDARHLLTTAFVREPLLMFAPSHRKALQPRLDDALKMVVIE